VACWRVESDSDAADAGYATAAGAMIALALSLVVTAVVGASLTDLRLSRTAFDRGRAEVALDGVQELAALAILRDGPPHRLRWFIESNIGPVEVLAEPEAAKLSTREAADLDDTALLWLGAGEPERVRSRLRAMALGGADARDLARVDPSPRWRGCAASLISPYGQSDGLSLERAVPPQAGRFAWRAGEVWRLRARSADGWTDDRIVRLVGDPEHPAAIIERVLARGQAGGEPCAALIEGRA
jgi:hypothetical protein